MIPPTRGENVSRDTILRGADLLITALLAVGTAGVLVYPGTPEPVTRVVGVPFLLVYPGYAVISAAFPEGPRAERGDAVVLTEAGTKPGWIGRLAFSLATSAVAIALIVVALSQAAAIRLVPVVAAVLGVTLVAVAVAAGRRYRLNDDHQAAPLAALAGRFDDSGADIPTVALLAAVLLLLGTVAVVGGAAPQGQQFTESSLLTEDANGSLVADGYPTTFVAGEGHPLTLAVENNEGRSVTYEVVVLAQRVSADGSVTDQRRLDAFAVNTARGEREVTQRTIAPTMTGDNIRLRFRIYKRSAGDATNGNESVESTDPEVNSDAPDQTLQLWIEVVEE